MKKITKRTFLIFILIILTLTSCNKADNTDTDGSQTFNDSTIRWSDEAELNTDVKADEEAAEIENTEESTEQNNEETADENNETADLNEEADEIEKAENESEPTPTPKPSPTPKATVKPTPKPTVAKESLQREGAVVYKTNSGKKFHRQGCKSLAKSSIETTYEAAVEIGLEACAICKP